MSFEYRQGQLFCDDTALERVAAEIGTPCYVYSKQAIQKNYRSFAGAFSQLDSLICYSVKSNSNLSILKLLKEEGSGFDVVSRGELYRLKQIGADPGKVVFSGVGKTRDEMKLALEFGILSLHVESLAELKVLQEVSRSERKRAPIVLRFNPDVDPKTHPYVATGLRQHKFGLDMSQSEELLATLKASPDLELRGLGFHIGSQILDVQPFLDAFSKLKALAAQFQSAGLEIHDLGVGGGIGIPYQDEVAPDLGRYASFLEEHGRSYRIIFEPGRIIVGNAGVLLCQVLYNKTNHGKRFVVVDGAMNDLIRPSLYQAHHEIRSLRKTEASITADVVGPVCESGDFFARDRRLPEFQQGDYLALMNAGAYGFVAASNYNSRPRIAEVLVDGSRFQVIRRREALEDLIRGEM